MDWGTMPLNNPPRNAEFEVKDNGPVVNMTASVKMLKGTQHFEVAFPAAHDPMNIPSNGTREIHVTFTPAAVGEFMDVVEVTDAGNPANRTGMVCKAKVVASE